MLRKYLLLLAAVATPVTAAPCNIRLTGAKVWTGSAFETRDVAVENRRIAARPRADLPSFDAASLYLLPSFVDAHTHTIDTPGPDDAKHKAAIKAGVFFALNPNNIRPEGPNRAPTLTTVELQAAGGGITRPGGHPQPLYEFLAARGWLGPVKVADLPGRAYHAVTTAAETRATVRVVQRNGASLNPLIPERPQFGVFRM